MRYLKQLTIITFGLLVLTTPALADVFTPNPSEDFHYVFSLDYKVKKLAPQNVTYEIMAGPRDPVIEGAYRIVIKNRANADLVVVSFDAAAMADASGRVTIPVPYQPSGVLALITGPDGGRISQVDLFLSSTCDDDRTCDAGEGENGYNCPSDCPKPSEVTSNAVLSLTPQVSPTDSVQENGSNKHWGLILLALMAGSGAAGVGLILHRYRSRV